MTSQQTWYILRGEMKYGPYDYGAMLAMMQKGELYDYNYVWAPHMEGWALVGELPEFSKDRLCRLIENKDEVAKSFYKREFPRKDVDILVFAHDGQRLFDGKCLSLSENGALCLLNNPLLVPQQQVVIHIQSEAELGDSFKVVAEIVRKNFSKQRLNVKSGLHYAVRFLQVSEHGRTLIRKLFKEETHDGIYQVHE